MSDEELEELDSMSVHTFMREEAAARTERELLLYFNITPDRRSRAGSQTSIFDHQRSKSPEQEEIDRLHYLEKREELTRKKAAEYSAMSEMNMVELLARHKVLLIRVGYDGQADDSYFLECAKLIQAKTPHHHVVMNNVKRSEEDVVEMVPGTSFLWNWIPKSIHGYLRSPLYWLRTFLISMSSYRHHRSFKPTLIIVDAHPISIPLLKHYFGCPVVSFAFFQQILPREKVAKMPLIRPMYQAITNFCLKYADELFVPSIAIGKNYTKRINSDAYFPEVFYPPVNGDTVDGQRYTPRYNLMMDKTNTEPITILLVGHWAASTKFILAANILEKFFTEFVTQEKYKKRMKFIVIGYLDPKDAKAKLYRRRVIHTLRKRPKVFRKHVWYCTNPSPSRMWNCYRDCIAVLYMSGKDDFSWPLLESQYFGRPVLCLKSPFATEIIKHGVNGFLMDPDITDCATHLSYIYSWIGEAFAKNSASNYGGKLAQPRRSKIIEKVMMKFLPFNETVKGN